MRLYPAQAGRNSKPIQFIPISPKRIRLVCRLSCSYILLGEYRGGVLCCVTLVKALRLK